MLTGTALAYALHALSIPLLLLVPVVAQAAASHPPAGGQPLITRVEDPTTLEVHHAGVEGTHKHPQLLDKTPKPIRPARLRSPRPRAVPRPALKVPTGQGPEPVPQPRRTVVILPPPAVPRGPDVPTVGSADRQPPLPFPSGTPLPDGGPSFKSYHEYLSAHLREPMLTYQGMQVNGWYFRNLRRPDAWTIVRYRIRYDGTLLSVQLVDSSADPDEAQKAVEVIENAAPFLPLPGGVQEIEVTELFWNQQLSRCPPGSLADRLSQLDDGRSIIATPSPGTQPESAP
ncbi:MAG: hypothetical protein ACYCW6_27080, partial [Candidatus Xenobia bacterium]